MTEKEKIVYLKKLIEQKNLKIKDLQYKLSLSDKHSNNHSASAIIDYKNIQFIISLGENIKYITPSLEMELGYQTGELSAKKTTDIIKGESHQAALDKIKCLKPGSKENTLSLTLDLINKNKIIKTVEVIRLWNNYSQDSHSDFYIDFINHNSLDQSKLQLHKDSEKLQALGQMAGGIAHDFNNQLAGIMGYADMLRLSLQNNLDLYKYAEMIVKTTINLKDLINQLLAFSRKGKHFNKPVNIHNIITKESSLNRYKNSNSLFKISLLAQNNIVIGDPDQLSSCLANIIENANESMPDGGIINISTSNLFLDAEFCKSYYDVIKPGEYIAVAITDTGTGMDNQVLSHLFEPFFTTKGKEKKIGMGLPAVYGTVKNHHGIITVSSQLNYGSEFILYLPIIKLYDQNEQQNSQQLKYQASSHETIMVIDDEEIIRELLKDMLKKLGYQVISFYNGHQAILDYQKNWEKIDLIILDMIMPGMGGEKTFYEMIKINPAVKILLSSGQLGDCRNTQTLLRNGAAGFIPKPYQISDLAKIIYEILNKK